MAEPSDDDSDSQESDPDVIEAQTYRERGSRRYFVQNQLFQRSFNFSPNPYSKMSNCSISFDWIKISLFK